MIILSTSFAMSIPLFFLLSDFVFDLWSNLEVFLNILILLHFFLLISSLNIIWSEKVTWMIPIVWKLLRFTLCSRRWSHFYKCSMWNQEHCSLIVLCRVPSMFIWPTLILLLYLDIFNWFFFCLHNQPIISTLLVITLHFNILSMVSG